MIHIFISSAGADVREHAIGRAVPGYVVQAVDDAMQPVPPNTIGKLAVRGPTGCRYLADERQSKFVRDGWNLPGDSVMIDEDGYVFYQARADDMIVSAGYNISGPEVESVLMQYEHGYSLCISTQVGGRMGCRFCATTLMGREQNRQPIRQPT